MTARCNSTRSFLARNVMITALARVYDDQHRCSREPRENYYLVLADPADLKVFDSPYVDISVGTKQSRLSSGVRDIFLKELCVGLSLSPVDHE